MKLSVYARRRGIDAFTRDDFEFVGSKVATDPDRLILVGGQAIEVWGTFLGIPSPLGTQAALTEDADWLGGKQDAIWLCEKLGDGVELTLATSLESPNTALAYIRRPDGRILMMDFLRAIVGPSTAEVRRLAVTVRIKGITLAVLHPLLCLESRLANLAVLPHKRDGNGVMQAKWAVQIASAYLGYMAQEHSARDATRACHRVEAIALSRHARYCFEHFKIDPLEAVTPNVIATIGGRFVVDDWPRVVARLAIKRAKWRTK